ncbi:MAG: guanylate kinase [Clostridia bacterium]|jgi:guanylate kinase|nr:guanylate kinase [Clostridia bacterium]MDD4275853.1 guanylate kinase [Clostridia bacterium]
MIKPGKLIVISGPSGVGKTTIYEEIKKLVPNIKRVVTTTTRLVRTNEVNGIDYYFIKPEEFKQKIERDEFLEYAIYSNNFYGTTKQEVFNAMKLGMNVILILDIQGAMNIKKIYPDALFIFLKTTNLDILRRRLILRGTDNEEEIARRLKRAETELKYESEYDYIIINDILSVAAQEFKKIIEN